MAVRDRGIVAQRSYRSNLVTGFSRGFGTGLCSQKGYRKTEQPTWLGCRERPKPAAPPRLAHGDSSPLTSARSANLPGSNPQTLPGDFPNDPPFTLLHTTTGTSRKINPQLTFQYFLVSAKGTDLVPGHFGHYGQ